MSECDKYFQELREYQSKIPSDKDCKKCPYAENGSSRGMVNPCFDICESLFNPVLSIDSKGLESNLHS